MLYPFLHALRQRWTEQGIENPRPATASEIDAFEARFSVSLPPELREYFLALNGTRLGRLGEEGPLFTSFWHLDQVLPVDLEAKGVSRLGPDFERSTFVLADHSIWAIGFAITLTHDKVGPSPVYFLGGPVAEFYASSFEAFIERIVSEGFA